MAWILSSAFVKDCESWHYSPEPGGVSSEVNCSDGEPSAQSRSSHTVILYCVKDRMKAYSHLSQYGMTCGLLTENRGQELLTLYLGDFLAKTSAPRIDLLKESREKNLDSGKRCLESFAKYDPDLHSWKIPLSLLPEVFLPFSETWPSWGIMQHGESWAAETLELYTGEKEFGYSVCYPTILRNDKANKMNVSSLKRENPGIELVLKIERAVSDGIILKKLSTLKGSHLWSILKKLRDSNLLTIQALLDACLRIGGRLNPEWAEWLMGWPIGWTGLQPLETVKYQQSLH